MTKERDFKKAVVHDNVVQLSSLLKDGVNIEIPLAGAATALHHATANPQSALLRVLIERGANVNARDISRATPLHWAATIGNMAAAKLLIEHGAEIDARTAHDNTPLHRAAMHGRAETARLLIQHGADREAKNADQQTPAEVARESQQESNVKADMLSLLEGAPAAPSPRAAGKRGKRPKPRQR